MAHISLSQIVAVQEALSDPARILILRLLRERELLVGELVAVLKEPQHKVSRHLAVLKSAGLVRDWREGTRVHYEIAPGLAPEWLASLEKLRHAWDLSTEVQAVLWRLRENNFRPRPKLK
jgi:ArsR family transcriptional regulator